MNRQITTELERIVLRLEGKKGMMCEECGAKIMAAEAKKASDGKMLCEKCRGVMERGEAVEADLDEEKGPVLAVVPSQSNPSKTYEIRMGKDGNVYCNCPAWINQKVNPKERTCKHIKSLYGAMASQAKLKPKDEVYTQDGERIVLEVSLKDMQEMLSEGGQAFKKLSAKLKKKGAEDPEALAAWIGREKYGKAKFQKMALKGRK